MLEYSQEFITKAQAAAAFNETIEFTENKFLDRLKTVDYNSPEGLGQAREFIYDCFLDMGMDQLATAIDNVLSMTIEAKIDYIKENRCGFDDVLKF